MIAIISFTSNIAIVYAEEPDQQVPAHPEPIRIVYYNDGQVSENSDGSTELISESLPDYPVTYQNVYSLLHAFDRNGNGDYIASVASPSIDNTAVVGTPNIGEYVSIGYINDKTIYDLEGISESAGGSFRNYGVDLLGDHLTGKTNGLQVSYGKGLNLKFEVHIVRSYSKLLNDWE